MCVVLYAVAPELCSFRHCPPRIRLYPACHTEEIQAYKHWVFRCATKSVQKVNREMRNKVEVNHAHQHKFKKTGTHTRYPKHGYSIQVATGTDVTLDHIIIPAA